MPSISFRSVVLVLLCIVQYFDQSDAWIPSLSPRKTFVLMSTLGPTTADAIEGEASISFSSSNHLSDTSTDDSTSSTSDVSPGTGTNGGLWKGWGSPPYVALITERSAWQSEERVEEPIMAITAAVRNQQVALVSVRVCADNQKDQTAVEERVVEMTKRLLTLAKEHRFTVVVSSEWIEAAILAKADGVHVKESHRPLIGDIRSRYAAANNGKECIIGTSAHSIESALDAWSEY